MRTAIISFILFSSLLPVRCDPLLSTSLASEPPPPPNTAPLPASRKMEVKWEPFRDIFENIIRPIGGEQDVATMLENVKEEDIDTLEGTLLDKAKDDPQFVEQILTHLIHIRERYIKLRKDWQKTIEDRDNTAKIFKARIVDSRTHPSSLLPVNGQPVQFTQSFTPNTGLTNVSPLLNRPTPKPTPPAPHFTILPEQQHITVSSRTLPGSLPPQLEDEEVEEDTGSFLGAVSHNSPPSDFFFVPNHVIDPQTDPGQIIFDTAIPQFASRGSPPAPPPHIAARRSTAVPTTSAPTTTTTQRPTRPWHFSSRATTTLRPETVPWWWTTTTTPVPTTTTTTVFTSTREAERSETKAGIHYDQANNRTVYRYFWKPNTEEEAVVPEMIDENGKAHSAVPLEPEPENIKPVENAQTEQESVTPSEEETFEEFNPHDPSPPPLTTVTSPPTTQVTTTRRLPPSTARPSPATTASPQRPSRFEPVPEFVPRHPKTIRTSQFDVQSREENSPMPRLDQLKTVQELNRPQGFRTVTGSRNFVATTAHPRAIPEFEERSQFEPEQRPLESWEHEQRPTTTTRAVPTTTTRRVVTTTTTTERPTTTTTEEQITEVPSFPEFAPDIEDISQFQDEFSEKSVDERDLVNILNKEEEQRGVTEAKWFSGADTTFDKDQPHLSGSPKRFIPEFPGEVDPQSFPVGENTEEQETAQSPKHIVFTEQHTVFTRPPTTPSTTTSEQTTAPPSISSSSFIEETAEQFEETTVETEQIETTTETVVDEVLNETADEISQAFADFERVISTKTTEGPTAPPTESPTEADIVQITEPITAPTTVEDLVTAQQQPLRHSLRQGVRAPPVVVWGRRPPKNPSTSIQTAPPSIRPTKRPRKTTTNKVTQIPDEISLLDELLQGTTKREDEMTTQRSISELEKELAREAKISNFFDEDVRTTLPEGRHSQAIVRGRTPGRKIRGRKMSKRVNTNQFVIRAMNRDERLSPEETRIALGLPGKASRPHYRRTTPLPVPVDDGVQLLVQDLEREFRKRGFDEQKYTSCNAIKCDFEKNDLCEYESSLDELIFGDDLLRRRRKRSALDSFITVRAWTNWGGTKGDPALGNIALASGRVPSDVFAKGKNERFAVTQVNPSQMAMMSTQINATESLRILFDVWEGTRGVQLRVCCDSLCPFETELGVKKGSRNWLPKEVICPVGTRQLSFECTNTGKFRGACGVDNIRMDKC